MSEGMVMYFANKFEVVREKNTSEKNTLSGRSLLYKMKSNGPSIEPCGTPEVMMPLEEMETLFFTD